MSDKLFSYMTGQERPRKEEALFIPIPQTPANNTAGEYSVVFERITTTKESNSKGN
ncbi:MAG: hypothetical protein GY940_44875 [bacterium]|nr:hypothetical protein [bacterium]